MNRGYEVIKLLDGFASFWEEHNTESNSFNPDRPILSRNENKLRGREKFASILANSIGKYKSKECLVIGVHGEWGEGKTSVVNMAFEKIRYNAHKDVLYFQFTPWLFSNQEKLLFNFFNELHRFLRKHINKTDYSRIDKIIKAYSRIIFNSSIIPEKEIDDEKFLESIEQLKHQLNRQLRQLDKKIIILIDDIDRLDKEETLSVFKLVKVIGDFPNLVYVLPFDKEKVTEKIDVNDDYIKKIIQLEIKIPPILQKDVFEILTSHIVILVKEHNCFGWNERRWNDLLFSGLKYYIKNIRDVNRLINSLQLYISAKNKDLNIIDFICLSAIQIFDYELYRHIASNKNSFLVTDLNEIGTYSQDRYLKIVEESYDISVISNNENTKNFLRAIFPTLDRLWGNMTFQESQYRIWRREYRICSAFEFDKFFLLPVDNNIMSKSELDEIVKSVNNEEQFLFALQILIRENKFNFFIERFEDYFTYDIIKENVENIINGIIGVSDIVVVNEKSIIDEYQSLKYLIRRVIKSLEGNELQFGVYEKLFVSRKHPLYILIELYDDLCEENEVEFRQENNFNPNFEESSNGEALQKLRNLLITLLNVRSSEIKNEKKFGYVLYWWRKLEPEKMVQINEITANILSDKGNIIKFLDDVSFTQNIFSSNKGNRSRVIYDMKFIDQIIPKEKMKELVEKIEEDKDFMGKLDMQIQGKISTFNKCYHGEINPDNRNWE